MNDAATAPFALPISISPEARAALADPPPRPTYPALDDLQGWKEFIRKGDEASLTFLPPAPDGVTEQRDEIDGAAVYVHRRLDVAEGGPVYLSLHPGGLINMGGEVCRRIGALSAQTMGVEVWSVDYRMPPEHPFPAGLNDCVAAYALALESRPPTRLWPPSRR